MFPGLDEFNSLSTTLTVLSTMITPVVLISACASLVISTANRLGRTIDRTRKLLDRFEQLTQLTQQAAKHAAELAAEQSDNAADASTSPTEASDDDEGVLLFEQLSWAAQRSKLLHRALASLYLALSIFVATSVALGFIAKLIKEYTGWSADVLPRQRELRFDEMEYALPIEAGPACFQEIRQRVKARWRQIFTCAMPCRITLLRRLRWCVDIWKIFVETPLVVLALYEKDQHYAGLSLSISNDRPQRLVRVGLFRVRD
jgi:hypothetical protein